LGIRSSDSIKNIKSYYQAAFPLWVVGVHSPGGACDERVDVYLEPQAWYAGRTEEPLSLGLRAGFLWCWKWRWPQGGYRIHCQWPVGDRAALLFHQHTKPGVQSKRRGMAALFPTFVPRPDLIISWGIRNGCHQVSLDFGGCFYFSPLFIILLRRAGSYSLISLLR